MYWLMYILYNLITAVAAKKWLYLADTNDSISRQSVTAVLAAAAIITFCSRPFIDNAGVRLQSPPSAHDRHAVITQLCCLQNGIRHVLHSLVFRSFFLGHMWHRRRLFSALLSVTPPSDEDTPVAAVKIPDRRAHFCIRRRFVTSKNFGVLKRTDAWPWSSCVANLCKNNRLRCGLPCCQFGSKVIHRTNALYSAMSSMFRKNATEIGRASCRERV